MEQSPNPDGPDDRHDPVSRVSRRTYLAGVGALSVAGLAGCSSIADRLAGMVLEDVNVFNETDGPIDGAIEIVGPDEDRVLEERFELAAQEDDEEENREESEALEVYEDVWDGAGEYEVSVELDDGFDVRGESRGEETVTIAAPDDEMLAVAFGAEDVTDGIHFAVGESWSEFVSSDE